LGKSKYLNGVLCVEYVLVCFWQIYIEFSGIIFQEFHVTSANAAVYNTFGEVQ